jgi:hypothetical protein
MEPWDGWETGRVVLAVSVLLYLGVWMQLSAMHWAAAFRRWQMWAPVAVTPLFVMAAAIGLIERSGAPGYIAALGLAGGVVEGLLGAFFHLQGVSYQVGGLFSVRNLVVGPPPLLPVAYSFVGVFGLVGLLWGAT